MAFTASLKTQLNALAPVTRLPPEVIAEIFSILCDVQDPDPSLEDSLDLLFEEEFFGELEEPRTRPLCVEKLGWMLVTQVCSDWRSVAVNTPTLWKRITWSLGHSWASRMFSNSRLAPISVRMEKNRNRPIDKDDPELIGRHLSHMRHLYLSIEDASPMDALLKKANGPTPLLQTLHLAVHTTSNFPRAQRHVSTTQSDLFGGYAPGLRKVDLFDVSIPWTSPLFKGLHWLSMTLPIQSFPRDEDWAPTLTQFLDVLQNMPKLNYLKVEGSLPTYEPEMASSFLSSNVRRARLGRLRKLHLGGRTLDVALALRHLSVPLSTELSLAIVSRAEHEDAQIEVANARKLFTVLSNHINPREGDPIPIHEISVTRSSRLEINVYPDSRYGSISLQFEDCLDRAAFVRSCFEDLLFRPIPMMHLMGLGWQEQELLHIFGQPGGNASTVRSMFVSGSNGASRFCTFLCCRSMANIVMEGAIVPMNAGELPLPALNALEFTQSDFNDEVTRRCLTTAVRMRKECGIPLEVLAFTDCSLPDDDDRWLEELEGFVPNVRVEDLDGYDDDF
ncbi:hypothetical protein EWM64_g109 [Hericium alpestre]|uniref:Uncharacterized protein n=1 Tax=Hericium alpestre TaxID=135208 RepID=A0A4Z0A9Y2_9AGAM|nr:hypothetical protein EWM64_g109 [Hericium alpestre]